MALRSCSQEPDKHYDTPRVSPYRLAAHLASAFSIYAVLFWTTLSLAAPVPALADAAPKMQQAAARLRGAAVPLAALIAVTASSGKR
jgi:cytochrome c oxidase assembly protein subunit 15